MAEASARKDQAAAKPQQQAATGRDETPAALARLAAAVDAPNGTGLGIRELLGRLEAFVETDHPTFDTDTAAQVELGRLGALSDPQQYRGPVDIDGWGANALGAMLDGMMRIRAAEQALGKLVESKDVICPVHLAVGQEAIPVGVSHALNASDRVFGGHRSHGHYLAMGADLDALFAEVLGKDTGCAGGMGGSMHLFAPEVGFWGSVPIVAATIPVAVGAALAAKMDGKGGVAVAYFGDGAAEEGVLHEALNMASVMKLPVLFVCENNLYASHMDIAQRQPHDSTARFAHAHGVASVVCDGNDAVAVARAAGELIANARAGSGPGYLEAVTYRWFGHVGPDENIDVGLRRSAEELAAWKQRDPVARLAAAMVARGDITDSDMAARRADAEARCADAVARAKAAPYPATRALMDRVYARQIG